MQPNVPLTESNEAPSGPSTLPPSAPPSPPSTDHFEQEALFLLNQAVSAVVNERTSFLKRGFDARRDLNAECGYPDDQSGGLDESDPAFYRVLFDRDQLANRIISMMPKECFASTPTVYETEDPDDITEFEQYWDDLPRQLRGQQSWYQDEVGSPVWEVLKRADIRSRIGRFGVVLIGIADGKNLAEPIEAVVKEGTRGRGDTQLTMNELASIESRYPGLLDSEKGALQLVLNAPRNGYPPEGRPQTPYRRAGSVPSYGAGYVEVSPYSNYYLDNGPPVFPDPPANGNGKPKNGGKKKSAGSRTELLYLRVFDESQVTVVRREPNVNSPRFGQPLLYRITLEDSRDNTYGGAGNPPYSSILVHWSRVLHINDVGENADSSEWCSIPVCRPALNRILDCRKIYGASGEGYWRSCFSWLFLTTPPALGNVKITATQENKFKDALERLMQGLDRSMISTVFQPQSIGPSVVDPTPFLTAHLTAICYYLGCPMRIFMGSERGELASTQDQGDWHDKVRGRQSNYVTPRIIVPFIDRLILMGVLPEPKKKRGKAGDPTLNHARAVRYELTRYLHPDNKYRRQYEGSFLAHLESRYPLKGLEAIVNEAPSLQKKSRVVETPGGYSVEWPDVDALSQKDKAGIASAITSCISNFVKGGGESFITPLFFATKVLGWDDEEARSALEEAAKAHEEQMTQTMPPLVGGRPAEPAPGSEAFAQQQRTDQQAQDNLAIQKAKATSGKPPRGKKSNGRSATGAIDQLFAQMGRGDR